MKSDKLTVLIIIVLALILVESGSLYRVNE